MDLKSIIGIAIVAVGIFMIFKDQIFSFLKSSASSVQAQATPLTKEAAIQVAVNKAANEACLGELEGLILALDQDKDNDEIDYLIDKLGPKLIRRRLGK